MIDTPIDSLCSMVTADRALADVFQRARRVARTDEAVLILGETGAGKEGLASALHSLSNRRSGPFEAVNCAVLGGELASSELFGHERGAFTGADRRRVGVFERASGGTVFLDEIGELIPGVQGRLLRLLETRKVMRLGGEREVGCDFRLVAATHRDLVQDIAEDRFRRDLFYRVGVIVLHIPPLRDRPDDVELLAGRLLRATAPNLRWSRAATRALRARSWPGNVRELRNVVGRVAALLEGPIIGADDIEALEATLPSATASPRRPSLRTLRPDSGGAGATEGVQIGGRSLQAIRHDAIRHELARQHGNISQAARILQVARSTIYSAMGTG